MHDGVLQAYEIFEMHLSAQESMVFNGLCFDCGNKYGKPRGEMAVSCWLGRCYCCGEEKSVTGDRNYGFPIYPKHPEYLFLLVEPAKDLFDNQKESEDAS